MTRSEDFSDGYERVRSPQFESIQQQHNRNYMATSVLDNLMPNSNGMGSQDFQRALVGKQQSAMGTSQSTWDTQLWLSHKEPSNRAKRLNKDGSDG